MENKHSLASRLARWDPSLDPSNVIYALPFSLSPQLCGGKTDGIAAQLTDRTVIWENGKKLREIPNSEIEEYSFRLGIGCVFADCKLKSGEIFSFGRADMQYKDLYAAVLKHMTKYLQSEWVDYTYEEEINRICPKCGRPFRPGSYICDHCVDKRKYLIRLWNIARPYRFHIFGSILLYILIAMVNLVPPYLNRLLVDDYIQAETKPIFWQVVICKGWFLHPNTYDCGSFVVN